ncbi:MAG: FAD-dependent oxidoreductase [Hyphomicrobiaceae bacterium]|nr:FAD-dependent oxidoreductase [Hyphomicrobiaceae bacterium]
MTSRTIIVAGAGVFGLWQALSLAKAGHRVRLLEASVEPFTAASSRLAGAMLLPDCEGEASPAIVRELGRRGVALWRAAYPGLVTRGSLVLANARDKGELTRFARMTERHTLVEGNALAELEPDIAGRFSAGLHYAEEAHMETPRALAFLLAAAREAGVEVMLGTPWHEDDSDDLVIDCRGMGAREALPDLRGVRGERFLVRTQEVHFSRSIHLLHPRQTLYVVPWSDGVFLIGATLIESEDTGPVSVRSALELLGLAYALHPAFGEAQLIESAAGLRPSFADNVPRAVVSRRGTRIAVNGAWRHGFLLAPVMAEAVLSHLSGGEHELLRRAV